jgi:hypothetical protein
MDELMEIAERIRKKNEITSDRLNLLQSRLQKIEEIKRCLPQRIGTVEHNVSLLKKIYKAQ